MGPELLKGICRLEMEEVVDTYSCWPERKNESISWTAFQGHNDKELQVTSGS